ncbi:hypothetical protein PHLCEN_2v9305 [Hermanssonia centrifuga]|uniref:Uncharacterized protein n=1 Tax=Hermanssonia centrifuga TaxID=98765 RepID=A0A2R6NR35_9APHY|nr:hypothetical protein PHLCEN_2v9305 [Hermanssonia centrifuga]
MFPQSSTSHNGVLSPTIPPKRKAIPSANPKKAAQLRQVELMKMRHRAQPGDPRDKDKHVAVDQKLHLKVYIEEQEGDERFFWFRKTMGTGKALDLLASQMGVSSDTVPLYLVKVPISGSEDRITLQNDKLLVEQVEDGMQVALSR